MVESSINEMTKMTKVVVSNELETAIGPLSTDLGSFTSQVVRIGVAAGGVISIALLAYGAFTVLTSAGEPEKLMNGREIITNALSGLALIVLSVFVLEFLGLDILGITELNQWFR